MGSSGKKLQRACGAAGCNWSDGPMEAGGCIGESACWHWNAVRPQHGRLLSALAQVALLWRDPRRSRRERNSGVWMAVNEGEKASTIFALDRSGRRREILRRERHSFDSDGEGQ